ncbi:hypothetical protein H6F44_02365 [Pseudanabaena sp. FACHB-1277]|uniref:Uncharacterized protein n=1 Tax=Pseudanabaena cinerea FACHB-1277 TaxID=2949581 RepID=A0A926US13_9CYAN|nr:hypothetical protein [Pseudanabaena cinerea]MBD2148975.1 hypothetical protein [Pseudanabaena cinerea FACHB-1277]
MARFIGNYCDFAYSLPTQEIDIYRGFYLGTDRVKTENKKYGFDGLQAVLDNLQTTIKPRISVVARSAATSSFSLGRKYSYKQKLSKVL